MLEIRRFTESDSAEAINALLRECYRPLAEAGMNYSAATEDVEATRENISEGECYLVVLDGKIVAAASGTGNCFEDDGSYRGRIS